MAATTLYAETSTDDVMEALAHDIIRHLNNEGQKQVAVDAFDAPTSVGSNMQFKRRLKEKLASAGEITLVEEPKLLRTPCWYVQGSYKVSTRENQAFAQVTAQIYDQNDVPQHRIVPFPFQVNEISDVTVVSAATFDAIAASDKPDKNDAVLLALQKAIARPDVVVSVDGRVAASPQSPYAIELLVCNQQDARPLRADYYTDPNRVTRQEFQLSDGTKAFAKADLKQGELYAVRLHNQSETDVAVRLNIDGLSSFEFSEIASYRATDVWIIPRRSSGTVYGWHRTNEQSDSFEITHLPESAIGRMGAPTAKTGTIQAIFFQAWTQDETPPPGELVRSGAAHASLATKQGEELRTSYEETRHYFSKTPISSVCIQYAK